MSIIFLVGGCLCVGYIILIYNIHSNWGNYSPNVQKLDTIPNISIVIAARNEASSISACLESIYKNEYPFPNFEVIVVDDHSTDQTSQIARSIDHQNISVTVLSSPGQGKKAAVDYGISMAKFPNILCTDADSIVSNQWLISHATSFNTTGIAMSCGVVLPTKGERFIENFQWLDFAATMAITSYGINKKQFYLANGANIGFTKVGFYGVNGFSGNAHLASGDDVFLAQKFAESNPNSIRFLQSKDAIVYTKPATNWSAFFNQRKRWASKSSHSSNQKVVAIQSFVFIFSTFICASFLVGIWVQPLMWIGIIAMCTKLFTDYIFLLKLSKSLENPYAMKFFVPSFFFYFIHIFLSGWHALFPSSYQWKDRNVS